MLSAAAFLLDRLTIRNLCLVYFVLSPLFLSQGERIPALWVFLAGHLVTVSLLGLTACRRLAAFDESFRPDRLTLLVVGLVVLALVSVFVNTPANLLRPDKIVLWYVKLAFPASSFLVMVSVLKSRDVPLLVGLLFGVCGFSVLVVGLQAATGFPSRFQGRYTSFFFDPNGYVFLLNAVLAFALPTTLGRILEKRRFLLHAAAVLLLLGLIQLTGSRGGLLMAALLVVISVLATRAWKVILLLSLATLPIIAAFAWSMHVTRSAQGSVMSDMGRVWTNIVAFSIIRENPFFGVGYGGVVDVFMEYGRQFYLIMGRAMDTHNAFLGIMAETGVGGFILFATLLFGPLVAFGKHVFRRSRGNYPALALAGLNLMVGFVVYGMFYPHFLGHDDFWAYYVLVVLMLRSWRPGSGFGGISPLEREFPFSRAAVGNRTVQSNPA